MICYKTKTEPEGFAFTSCWDTGGPADYAQVVTALNAYFLPQVNTAFAIQTFYQLKQKTGQTAQQGSIFELLDAANVFRHLTGNQVTFSEALQPKIANSNFMKCIL